MWQTALRRFSLDFKIPESVIGHPFEIQLKLKSREFVHNTHFIDLIVLKFCNIHFTMIQSFKYFAKSTTESLPWSVQNSKTILQVRNTLWANEISRDLGLIWVWGGYIAQPSGFPHSGSLAKITFCEFPGVSLKNYLNFPVQTPYYVSSNLDILQPNSSLHCTFFPFFIAWEKQ